MKAGTTRQKRKRRINNAAKRQPSTRQLKAPKHDGLQAILQWLLAQGYWKALLGIIALIFAWRIAFHFFP